MKDKITYPSLINGESTYKIVVPEKVESKIRLFCREVWDLEWSGVLFYTVEGSFETEDLVINCVDICLMDVGTAGLTSFTIDADVVSYMSDNIELLNPGVYQGLIHSHNNMSTFFSGTDIDTLVAEGHDMAHFVSLIINNKGIYTAAITRRGTKQTTTVSELKYPTWGNITKVSAIEKKEEKEVIIKHLLNVEYSYQDSTLQEASDRMSFIKAKKEKEEQKLAKKKAFTTTKNKEIDYSRGIPMYSKASRDIEFGNNKVSLPTKSPAPLPTRQVGNSKVYNATDLTLPFESFDDDDYAVPYGLISCDPTILLCLQRQLLTGCALLKDDETVDIDKWALSMNKMYAKRFKNRSEFKEFAGPYVDFLINNVYDLNLEEYFLGDETYTFAIVAHDLRESLSKLTQNEWLDIYIAELDNYIL